MREEARQAKDTGMFQPCIRHKLAQLIDKGHAWMYAKDLTTYALPIEQQECEGGIAHRLALPLLPEGKQQPLRPSASQLGSGKTFTSSPLIKLTGKRHRASPRYLH